MPAAEPPEIGRQAARAHQFDTPAQQRHAATAGLWLFLATEVLFFGGLFFGYTVYRVLYPHAFRAASVRACPLSGWRSARDA